MTVDELRKRRAQLDADTTARRGVLQAERLQRRRDNLISGEWWPPHDCNRCLQAILDKNPAGVCEDGQRYKWW